jgi:hypothetical protein
MVVGEHYNRLRNIYDFVDDLHIILTVISIYVILNLVIL